jgi:hypothetical protein
MTDPPRHARTLDTSVRRWSNLWIGAVTTFGVSGLLQWVVLPPGGTLAEIAKGVEIAAIVVGICGLFRWAVLFERQKSSDDKKPQDA